MKNTRANVIVPEVASPVLESAFLLRATLRDRAHITLVSDRPDFPFKPNTIYIAFGGKLNPVLIPLSHPTAKRDIELVHGSSTGDRNGAAMSTATARLTAATGVRHFKQRSTRKEAPCTTG